MNDKDLFETKAQGYKVENGKLVYFSNLLNGYRHEYKDLQEICEEMNGLLKKFDSYEEQLAFWKGKAEEKIPEDSVVLTKEEFESLKLIQSIKLDIKKINETLSLSPTDIERIEKQTSKETAEKIIEMLVPQCEFCDENWHERCLCLRTTIAEKIAKQYGVEIKE